MLPQTVRMDQLADARILIVEDENADLLLLDQLLRSAGFNNVGLSSDPATVVAGFNPDQVDLIILDLWMPGYDGFAVLREIRSRCPPDSFLPVLVVTADVTLESRRKALMAGATDFLTKPVDVVEVTLRVRHLLEVRRLQVALAKERADLEESVLARTAELEQANRRLEELLKAKDQFVAGVSHELRTPLTGVLGLAKELAENRNTISAEEAMEIARNLAEEAGEAAAIIEDLLVAARGEVGEVTVRLETVDLRAELDLALRSLRHAKARITLPDVGSIAAAADAQRVRQILRNLIGNAIRHGGPNVAVEIAAKGRFVEVIVKDDGPGIPEERGLRLFDPFVGDATQPQSIGLGLTVSRQLARLMGGDLALVPTARGSVFMLTLPLGPA